MQDLLGAECDLAEILCVYSLHKNLSGLSEGIYRIGLICGGGGCERACKCAARRAGAASVEFDRNLCGSIFYAIFNHIYAILARLERKRCGFENDHQSKRDNSNSYRCQSFFTTAIECGCGASKTKKSKIKNSRLTVFRPVQRAVAPVDFKATHTRLTALKSSTRAHLHLTSSIIDSRTCHP